MSAPPPEAGEAQQPNRAPFGLSRAAQNTIANFIGQAGSSGLTLLFSVVYFRILGSENFGLVSFCTTVLLIGNLFVDLGLGRTVTRELARRAHDATLAQDMRDALFTLQIIHFGLAIACGIVIALSSSWLASNWLNTGADTIDEAARAIALLGAVAALQLPRELCRSALAGLQRQIQANMLATFFAALRGVITIAALLWIDATPTVFLIAQVVASLIETGTMLAAVWIAMPPRERAPRFAVQVLHDVWVFALSDGLALLVGVGMSLADRIVLSRLLPLDAFGSYSLAILIGDIVLRIVGPFSTAYFPHFADLLARKDERKVSEDYGHAGAIVSVLFVPAFVAFAAFAQPIMHLASGSAEIAAAFAWVLALRALGNGIIGLQYMPHALQLAAGVATTALYVNIAALCFYLPGIVILSPTYGYLVPGILWLFVVSIQTPVMIYVTHRITLRGEAWTWTMESIIRPVVISLAIIAPLALVSYLAANSALAIFLLFAASALAALAILLASPRLRPLAVTLRRRIFRHAG